MNDNALFCATFVFWWPEMINEEIAARIALSMYANEPCRICGEMITEADLSTAVFAGYSADNTSRSAHAPCWDKQLPQKDWAIPE